MITSLMTSGVDQALADNSLRLLWSSALVLTLAMLSFTVDLAGHPGRQARAAARRAGETQEVAEAGGDTAVVTKVETEAPDVPEKRQWAGIGISLSWLGALLLAGLAVTAAGLAAWGVLDDPPLEQVNPQLRRVERFWSEQIRYIY